MRRRYAVSFWDSLVIASALEAQASVLYSEDLQHEQVIEDRLKIINPFVN
jgi:predicted nucleic acid-binding protein